MSITSVHPVREEAVNRFLERARADCSVARSLIAQGQLVEVVYAGRTFYARRLHRVVDR